MAAKTPRCRRCGRRLRKTAYLDAMARGNIQNLTCAPCLTPLEAAEMAVNAATMETAVTRDGRILARPKVRRRDLQDEARTRTLTGNAS